MWMSGKISEKNVKLKRAYERPMDSDGKRVLGTASVSWLTGCGRAE